MQHLSVFRNAAVGIGAINTDLSLVTEQVIPTSAAGRALMPWGSKITAAMATGVGVNRGRIVSPSLRRLPFPQIRPLQITIAPTFPLSLADFPRENCPQVLMNEEVNIQTSNTDAGAQAHNAYVWFEPMFEPAPPGPMWTIRATAAIVAAANVWTTGVLTLEDQLPQGRYAVVGMDVWGTNLLVARLIWAVGNNLRPGVPCGILVNNPNTHNWRYGREGKFGEFTNTTIPQLEIFTSGATATQEVFLDVVPIGLAA